MTGLPGERGHDLGIPDQTGDAVPGDRKGRHRRDRPEQTAKALPGHGVRSHVDGHPGLNFLPA